MTFLFTKQYGLQILGAEIQEREWVQRREGHAIVNIGHSLSLHTNKLLRSRRYRVSALPGQAMKERYSFAYFLRAEDETPMRAVNSPLVSDVGGGETVFTSGEWMKRRYAMLRKDTWNTNRGWILMGACLSLACSSSMRIPPSWWRRTRPLRPRFGFSPRVTGC